VLIFLYFAALMQTAEQLAAFPPAHPRLVAMAGGLAEQENLDLRGFEVDGSNITAISEDIQNKGPLNEQGVRHDGWTFAKVGYQFNSGACEPDLIDTSLQLTVILPDLVSRDSLSLRDKERWDRYISALVAQEKHHVALAVEGAERIEAAMRGAPDCDAAIAAGAQANLELQAAQDEFDRRTNHGALEGVQF